MASERQQKAGNQGAHGVQSAETVLQILSAFIGADPMPMLKTLAERTHMHPAKVHRYLVSLCRAGYVDHDPATSRYRLGPASLRLAFAAMDAIDAIRIAKPMMAGFCQRLQESVVLGVWNADGPTIAVKETLPGLLTMVATEGYTLPVLRSSIAAVFGTWLPREKTQSFIDRDLQHIITDPSVKFPRSETEIEQMFAEIRRRGFARTQGQFHPGTHSFAAPVFDPSGQIAAVLCAIGPSGQFNSNWDSPTAKTLLACAADVSRAFGYHQFE